MLSCILLEDLSFIECCTVPVAFLHSIHDQEFQIKFGQFKNDLFMTNRNCFQYGLEITFNRLDLHFRQLFVHD